MGLLRTTMGIESLTQRGTRIELPDTLVDPSSLLTQVPRPVLEQLGIAPQKWVRFQLADGSVIERDVGFAIVHAGDREAPDDVVFAEAGDRVFLGARSLSGMNLKVDMVQLALVDGGPMIAAAGLIAA